ncbi:MAG: hypothetical protein ACR2OE_08390 [Thermomicrobiales bacterium]
MAGSSFLRSVDLPVIHALQAIARYNGPNEQAMHEISMRDISDEHREQAIAIMEPAGEYLMQILTDTYLQREIDADQLIQVTIDALGLHDGTVSVCPAGTDRAFAALRNPAMSVVYQREQDEQPGDFPVRYVVSVRRLDDSCIKVFSSLARHLHVAFLSDVNTSIDDGDWKLFLPDGTSHVVELDPEAFDNNALVLQKDDRADLERRMVRSAHRVAA